MGVGRGRDEGGVEVEWSESGVGVQVGPGYGSLAQAYSSKG